MWGLSNAVIEAILVVCVALLLAAVTIAAVEHFQVKSLQADLATLTKKNAACEAESAQRGSALETQTKAVNQARADAQRALDEQKARAAKTIAAATKAAAAGGYARARTELAKQKPKDQNDLCPSAQRENADFIRGRS